MLGIYTVAVFVIEAIQKIPDWMGLVLLPKVTSGQDINGELTHKYAFLSFATKFIMLNHLME